MSTNITDKNTLKSWFRRGLKPLESQFAAWMDSYWHKNEPIPTASVEGLEGVLNNKAEVGDIRLLSESVGAVDGKLSAHADNRSIHFSMGDVADEISSSLSEHDGSDTSHADIRNRLDNIEHGAIPVKNAEYAEKLGTEEDHYTKTGLDAKINRHIRGVEYNPVNAVFTFTFEDGTTVVIDTPVEGTVKNGRFDDAANELVLVLVSGQEIRIPAAGLVKIYTGGETATAQANVSSGGKISVDLKQGGIYAVHLSETLLDAIGSHQTKTGDTKDNVVTFAEAAVRENVVSGEKLGVMLGKIRKWFSDLRGMAFRDSVNLSATAGGSSVVVGNDCGTGFSLPAATTQKAGVMSTDDRTKMVKLFDGSMLDSMTDVGYHRHNYLEMADLPLTVEIGVADFTEFRAAVTKLQQIVATGKFGRIVGTAPMAVTSNEYFDVKNIDISAGFRVSSSHHLHLTSSNGTINCSRIGVDGDSDGTAITGLTVKINKHGAFYVGELSLDRLVHSTTSDYSTPMCIIENADQCSVYIKKFTTYASNGLGYPSKGVMFRFSRNNLINVFDIRNVSGMSYNGRIYLDGTGFKSSRFIYTDSSCVFSNPETSDKITGGYPFNVSWTDSYVPVPGVSQRDQYHVLCGDGVWRDVRTIG